mgnify:CR=1 FL=1|tara:strand:+ start:25299 stop:26246 length:948 start_codon:yes stop_codon:yes gene_type:complete
MNILLASIIGFLFTNIFIYIMLPFLRSSLVDFPNNRSSHSNPTPSGAGISFVIISLILSPFLKTNLVYICLPLALLGFLDDKYAIPSNIRYFSQLVTGSILIIFCPNFNYLNDLIPSIAILVFILLLISVTAFINFTNFMDGLDGLVSGSMIVILFFACIINNLNLFPVVSCLMAFILWNWQPAKIFMGDSGSTFLGALYCGIILQSSSLNQAIAVVFIGTPLWADAFTCVIRRALTRQKVFSAHRLHLYQRLNRGGWSHKLISSIYMTISFFLAFIYLILGLNYLIMASFAVFFFGIFLDLKFASPFETRKSLK